MLCFIVVIVVVVVVVVVVIVIIFSNIPSIIPNLPITDIIFIA